MVSRKWMAVMVCGLWLAWYLWTPLPPHLDQRAMLMALGAFNKVIKPLARLAALLPICSNIYQPVRAAMDIVVISPALDSDPELQVTEEILSGVPVRIYRPTGAAEPLSPVLMYFHGGGWTFGSIDVEDHNARYLAKKAKVTVVSVDYRLAPEHPFPAALDDCVAATVHVLTHGPQRGLDPARVGVAGFSAGGNLATAVSLRLLDPEFGSLARLKHQVLLAPCLQGLDLALASYTENAQVTGAVLSQQDMAQCLLAYAGLPITPSAVEQVCRGQHIREQTRRQWAGYIHPVAAQAPGEQQTTGHAVNETLALAAEPVLLNHLVSPLLAPHRLLRQVPRAMLVLSHYDVLRDDGLLYVGRLRDAGVEVTSRVIQNGHHVSMLMIMSDPGSEITARMFDEIVEFIAD